MTILPTEVGATMTLPELEGGVNGNDNITHGIGSLWHWQLPELRAFVIILMVTDI